MRRLVDGAHSHGPAGKSVGGVQHGAEVFASVCVGLWLLCIIGYVARVLVIAAECVGFLAFGVVAGYIWVRVRRYKQQRLMIMSGGLLPYRPAAGRYLAQQQPQQLPAQQTLNLQLPANLSADDTLRVMRDLGRGR